MTNNLFEKSEGISTSSDSEGIIDSAKTFEVNKYKGWFCEITYTVETVEMFFNLKIASNTATKIVFEEAIDFPAEVDYNIAFVNRLYLQDIESDAANTVKLTDDLLNSKYKQVNIDLSNKVFSYLRGFYKTDFDPLNKILNLTVLQQVYSYSLLAKTYQDLSIDQDSFEAFKGYNMYEKSYIDGIRDALSLLQIDFNNDGEANSQEIVNPAATFVFMSR